MVLLLKPLVQFRLTRILKKQNCYLKSRSETPVACDPSLQNNFSVNNESSAVFERSVGQFAILSHSLLYSDGYNAGRVTDREGTTAERLPRLGQNSCRRCGITCDLRTGRQTDCPATGSAFQNDF